MNDRVKWKAEIEFEGSLDQLSQLGERLKGLPVVVRIPGWPRPLPFPGLVAIESILGKAALASFATSERSLNLPDLIRGGMQDAHIHVDGQVVLLEREEFIKLVGETAKHLAMQLAASTDDYVPVAESLAHLQVKS